MMMMMRPGTWAGIRNRTRPGGRRRSGSPPSTRSRPGGFARASSGSASAARRSNGRWRPTAWGPTGGESSGSRRKGRFSVGFHERKRPCRTPPTRTRADAARGRDALRVSGNASRVASRGERVESAPRPRRKRGAMWRSEETPRRGIRRDRKVVMAPTRIACRRLDAGCQFFPRVSRDEAHPRHASELSAAARGPGGDGGVAPLARYVSPSHPDDPSSGRKRAGRDEEESWHIPR